MHPRTILVINVSRIGDTLLATPAIRAVAGRWPEALIDVLGHPKRVEVLKNLPFIRHIGAISKFRAPFRGWIDSLSQPYDLAFVYGFDIELVRYALRVSRKVVAFRQNDSRIDGKLYRCVEPPQPMSIHAVHYWLTLTESLDIRTNNNRLAYQVVPEESIWARQKLSALGLSLASPLIGLHVATFPKKTYRRWPIESFSSLARRIIGVWPNAHFLIYGGSEENDKVEWLRNSIAGHATSFAGRLSLRESVAIMGLTHLHIGLDTGPTHLVSTFDIPLISLHHCRIPSRFILALDHPCCYPIDHPKLDSSSCSEQTEMSEITVDTVFETVMRALTEHPPQAR